MMSPLYVLLAGLVTVLGLILVLRLNAFLSLLAAALVVSLLAPGDPAQKVVRVAEAFGSTAGSIGIVIAMAAVIGLAMMQSGAADRIVQWFLEMLGEKRSTTALMSSSFALAIPVFYDTVFYLLVPLARSMYRRTNQHYLKYLMAIAAGGAITHTLVPPTPGPLIIAESLGVDIGLMMLVGAAIALPSSLVGMVYARWLDARMEVPMRPIAGAEEEGSPTGASSPGLLLSWLPILLPVLLISANTLTQTLVRAGTAPEWLAGLAPWIAIPGNPNLALILAAAAALMLFVRQRSPTRQQASDLIEGALMSGGIIILITAAGGAFGAMLKVAGIGAAIESAFGGGAFVGGFGMLLIGFLVASLLKVAQGSSTVAMITSSALLASLVPTGGIGLPMVFLATSIGSGSLVGSWMNDSGFWIFARMGGLTEVETLKSWTPLLVILGITGFVTTLLAAALYLVFAG